MIRSLLQESRLLGWAVFLFAGYLYLNFGTPGDSQLNISLVARSVFLVFAIWLFAYTHYKGAQKEIVSGVETREAYTEEKLTPWGEVYEKVDHPATSERYCYVVKQGRKIQTLLCIATVIGFWSEWSDELDFDLISDIPGIIAALAFVAGFKGLPRWE